MKINILSISDSKPMNYLVKTVLSPKHNVIIRNDVIEGVYELKRRKIKVVILNLDFQDEEIKNFIHHVTTSSLYNIPIIALSSNGHFKNQQEEGVFKYIIKPFDPVDLVTTVDEVISNLSSKVTSN